VSKISIILADDHTLVRQALRLLLDAEKDFSVIAETPDGLEAVRLVERLGANVLVVDLTMPSLNGLEVIRQVRQKSPETRIVVLSMHSSEPHVLQALRNGAAGYVLKDSCAEDLVRAIREVMAGRRYLTSPLSDRAVQAYVDTAANRRVDIYETLTTREREVLQMTSEGYTSGEIGVRLFISSRTVEVHRANLMRKLSLKNQTQLIRYALKRGLLPSEEPLADRPRKSRREQPVNKGTKI
jgi:DNA-binding NarL/FixJ family response regulator